MSKTEAPVDDIECTPDGLIRGFAKCFGFLLSIIVCVSSGVTAAAVYSTAQSVNRLTSDGYTIRYFNHT